ncbi:MAG: hypothetical protein KatS3mg062_0489 [Tepidiforma sp.]|nr:MAG: hypothetical protein KatS3mg062_0489 [Tepidiforma sp.]
MASPRPVPLTGYRIRTAVPGDAELLYDLWQRARQHNARVDPRILLTPIGLDQFAADLRARLGRGTATALVAEVAGGLAGFITGAIESAGPDRLPERHATIGYLWVEPPFRRQGIARALVEGIAQWASAIDGISHFEMPVLSADETAARFWAALGFRPFITRLWAPLQPEPEQDP